MYYFIWIVLDAAILWISTLISVDKHLQTMWNSQKVGKFLGSNISVSNLAWAFVIVVLLGASISWDVMVELRDIPGLG